MLWSALPSALASQVVQEHLGYERVNELIDRFKRRYHKQRTSEPNREQPLLYGDNIEYLEKNKGTMALFRLAESMGFNAFNQKVFDWIAGQHKPLVFKGLYLFLLEKGCLDEEFTAFFEKVP